MTDEQRAEQDAITDWDNESAAVAIRNADEDDYVQWVTSGPSSMTTLQLRGAQHAAERAGERHDARKLESEIAVREAKGDTA